MGSDKTIQQAALGFLSAFYFDDTAKMPDINWSRAPAFGTFYPYLTTFDVTNAHPRILREKNIIILHTALVLLAYPTTKSPWCIGDSGLVLSDEFINTHTVTLTSEVNGAQCTYTLRQYPNAVPLVIKAYNFFKSILSIPHEYDQRNL